VTDLLREKYQQLVELLDFIRKSEYTGQIREQDALRDSLLSALTAAIRANQHNPDAAKRDAARRLLSIVKHYGQVSRRKQQEESAAIDDIVRELSVTTFSGLIALLGLTALFSQVVEANNEFFRLTLARVDEMKQRPNVTMSELRLEVNDLLEDLLDRAEAIITLGTLTPSTELDAFVAGYNVLANMYSNSLAQEQGRRDASAGKDDDEDDDEDTLVDEGTQTGEDEPVDE
ncbi:MAG: DUF6261 family protein, partial [Odoribacteraceae bacterium]|nr:DUF6261 family protein [Odoribacteraceae bacterium]